MPGRELGLFCSAGDSVCLLVWKVSSWHWTWHSLFCIFCSGSCIIWGHSVAEIPLSDLVNFSFWTQTVDFLEWELSCRVASPCFGYFFNVLRNCHLWEVLPYIQTSYLFSWMRGLQMSKEFGPSNLMSLSIWQVWGDFLGKLFLCWRLTFHYSSRNKKICIWSKNKYW